MSIGQAIWTMICEAEAQNNIELAKRSLQKNEKKLCSIFIDNAEVWLNSRLASHKKAKDALK